MALHRSNDHVRGDSADDLLDWLRELPDCPPVTRTVLTHCDQHEDANPTWSFIEADARAGVARRRCVACGRSFPLLDSESHWTFPPMFSCGSCAQSMVEVGVGISTSNSPDAGEDLVEWVAVAVRCLGCGRIEGLTDLLLPEMPLAEVAAGL